MAAQVLALLAAACKSGPAPQPPAESPPAAQGGDVTGAWGSDACGDRAYRRELELAASGAFRARDLVAPCPPEAVCVWSGIVEWSGTWSREGTAVVLAETAATAGPGAAARPARLEVENGALVEVVGEERCGYAREGPKD